MRINPFIYGIVVLGIFFGVILGFQSAGIWSVSGKVTASGEAVQPSAADVNSIKGWMTLEQITTTYQIPLVDLLKQFELPADTSASTAIKDLENESFSVTNLRNWLQTRQDAAQTQPAENQPVPAATAAAPAQAPTATVTPEPNTHTAPDKTVTGKTTFQDLIDWGVPIEMIQGVIGDEMPSTSMVIKDYVTGKGMEFTTIKSALQAEVDKKK